jgi:hypothetical protein
VRYAPGPATYKAVSLGEAQEQAGFLERGISALARSKARASSDKLEAKIVSEFDSGLERIGNRRGQFGRRVICRGRAGELLKELARATPRTANP